MIYLIINSLLVSYSGLTRFSRFRLLCYAICLIGCLYQLISVSIVFWNYDSYLIREVETRDNFPIPGLSLCFDKSILIDRSKATAYLKSLSNSPLNGLIDFFFQPYRTMSPEERLLRGLSSLSIAKQHELTKSTVDLEFKCFLESYGLIDCETIFQITPYLTLYEKCFSFSPINSSLTFSRQIIPRRGQLRLGFVKPIGPELGSYLKVSVTSPSKEISFVGSQWYSVNYDYHNSVELTYTITRRNYLPAPYKTNCSENFTSQCVNHCLYEYFPNKTNLWSPHVPGFINNPYKFEYHDDIDANQESTVNVIKECEKKCDKSFPCSVEEYQAFLLSQHVEKFKPFFQISLTPPCCILIETLKPKITLVEFICYIGSTTGLWLGLSMYHMFINFDFRRLRLHKPSTKDFSLETIYK